MPISNLTERQREILDLSRAGLRTKDIAKRLGVSTQNAALILKEAKIRAQRSVNANTIDALPARARNALILAGFKPTDSVDVVVQNWDRVRSGVNSGGKNNIRRFGRQSLRIVEEWIRSTGSTPLPVSAGERALLSELEYLTPKNYARREVSSELRAIAAWIRTPGNINRDNAVDECARVLENRAAQLIAEWEASERE